MKLERILFVIIVIAIIVGLVLVLKPQADMNAKNAIDSTTLTLGAKETTFSKYKEIAKPSGFVNTGGTPITLSQYVGKQVILLDIMTYSCINCVRTFPYITSWYDKYKDKGLIVIGIHTPEFAFEHDIKNVDAAMKKLGITFPVVLDNDYGTWNAYGNQYWPRKYLIDIDGYVVYDHIGEGGYDETEKYIQDALIERAKKLNLPVPTFADAATVAAPVFDGTRVGTPELYFGSARNQYLGNGRPAVEGVQTLALPKKFNSNQLYLTGTWNFVSEYAETRTDSTITLNYSAKNVYMVTSANTPTEVQIIVDGKPYKTITVSGETLYTLVEGSEYGSHTLELRTKAGLKAFTFTFG